MSPPVSAQQVRPSQAPPPEPVQTAQLAALRAMKQTLPLKQQPLVPPSSGDVMKTLPLDGSVRLNGSASVAPTSPVRAPVPSTPPPAPSPVAPNADRKLQARVDSLARTQRVLMILIIVAFSVIAALVVALMLKDRR